MGDFENKCALIKQRWTRYIKMFANKDKSVMMCLSRIFLTIPIIFVNTSESPDRDCCEPLYPFMNTKLPINNEDDFLNNKTPLTCTESRKLCSKDYVCNQILELIPLLCGLEIVTCSTNTKKKCQAALTMLKKTNFFSQNCTCENPTIQPECNQIQGIVFSHPCMDAEFTSNSLPTCLQSKRKCDKNKKCTQSFNMLSKACIADN